MGILLDLGRVWPGISPAGLARLRQLRHEPEGDGDLVGLVMRLEVEVGDEVPRLPRLLADLDPRLAQRELALLLDRPLVVEEDVLLDPVGELPLALLARAEPPDLVPHDHLDV